jgi:hypothetical protein
MFFREHVMGQPYLTLVGRSPTSDVKLLSYNIRFGGVGRVGPMASVIKACAPDLVLLQEATRPDVVAQLALPPGWPRGLRIPRIRSAS